MFSLCLERVFTSGLSASIENFGMFQKHYFVQFEGLINLVYSSFSVSHDVDRENVQMTQERQKRSNKLSNGCKFEGCDGAKSF